MSGDGVSGEKTVELDENLPHKAIFGLGKPSIIDCAIFLFVLREI